jgi:HSP20 family molecular chaperone IbpA
MSALRDALRDLPDAVFADVLESDDAYLLVMDLPGVTADGLTVSIEGGKLVLEAERAKAVPDEFEYVREDRSLFLDAELPLPPDVTESGAEGDVSDGVLELRLPKATTGRQTTIPIEDAR